MRTVATCLFILAAAFAGTSLADPVIVTHVETITASAYPRLTMFLRMPQDGAPPRGVLCLCLLGESPDDIKQMVQEGKDRLYQYAARHQFAILAWGARRMWPREKNWYQLSPTERNRIDATFDKVANGWDRGVKWFVKNHGIPPQGYLMHGRCGAGQFAQRLAFRCPERFLAVHMDIPGSFDQPKKSRELRNVLWCLTTGERLDGGYERSLGFFLQARQLHWPLIYKAYPSVSHSTKIKETKNFAMAVFDYALEEQARAIRRNRGKFAYPDWLEIFASAGSVADIKNQVVVPIEDFSCIPFKNRMLLPDELAEAWLKE